MDLSNSIASLNADLELSESYNSTNDVIAYRVMSLAGIKTLRISGTPKIALTANKEYILISAMADTYKPQYPFTKIIWVGSDIKAVLSISNTGSIGLTPLSNIAATSGININEAYF